MSEVQAEPEVFNIGAFNPNGDEVVVKVWRELKRTEVYVGENLVRIDVAGKRIFGG